MASLTPLSKGLIGLAVVGAMASAVWHLGLKERLGADAASAPPAPASTPAVQNVPEPQATPLPSAAPTTETAPSKPTATSNVPAAQLSAADNAEKGRQLLEAGNLAQARLHLEQAVKDGDGSAACLLGEMTMKGQGGLTSSHDKAASLFQLAQSRGIICFASGQ